jgi:hypothetical protein
MSDADLLSSLELLGRQGKAMTTKRVLLAAIFLVSCTDNGVPIGDRNTGGASGSAGSSDSGGVSGSSGASSSGGVSGSGRGGASAGSNRGGTSPADAGLGGSDAGSGGSDGGMGGSTGGTSGGGSGGGTAAASGDGGAPSCGEIPVSCCWTDADCASPRCYGGSCATERPGRCAAPPAAGRCYDDSDCVVGFVCLGGRLAPCNTDGPDLLGTCSTNPCPVATTCIYGVDCQCELSGQCTAAGGPQGNGYCRGADGVCHICLN